MLHSRIAQPLRVTATVLGMASLPLGVAACGDDEDTSPSGATTTSANSAEQKPTKFAVLTKLGDNPYFIQEVEGAKAAAEELGGEVSSQDLQLDAGKALNAVNTAIASGVDGIAIAVPDQKIGPAIIKKAADADIPLVALDDTIKDASGKEAPFAGFDAPSLGKAVGDEVSSRYEEAGWADDPDAKVGVASVELQSLDVCMQRTDAAAETFLAANPEFDKSAIKHISYDGTLNKALSAVKTTITANPDIKRWIIWSCNDDGVLGAVRALEQSGVAVDDAIGVGLGGNLACGEFKKGKETSFVASVYADSYLIGEKAIQALHAAAVDNAPLPERQIVPGKLVTRDNYQTEIRDCG